MPDEKKSTTAEPAVGDIVYLRDGQKCQYLGRVESGHVLAPYAADEWDDEYPSDLSLIEQEVWGQPPPRKIYHEEITDLEASVERKADELAEIHGELEKAQTKRKALIAKLSQITVLHQLDDYLEGKIRYFVRDQYDGMDIVGPDHVITVDDTPVKMSEVPIKFDLVGEGMKMGWELSGRVFPFATEEQAREKLRDIIANCFAKGNNRWRRDNAIKACKIIGMEVPREVASKFEAERRATAGAQLAGAIDETKEFIRAAKAAGVDRGVIAQAVMGVSDE